ncbi:MAG: diaminopimelate epimerase [Candidatus Velthaea sp.]
MIASVPVVKLNATRNDFVLVDGRTAPLADPAAFARRVCDRTTGIGADGVLLVLDSEIADARMRIFNADGSEAEMCGNGMRCVARYLDEHDQRASAVVETLAGPIATNVVARSPEYRVSVEVNVPAVGIAHTVNGFSAIPVDVGNPHVVIFVDDVAALNVADAGPRIERDARYPHGTNVHFAQISGPASLRVIHWERGAGATRSCGTGAVACAAAAIVTRGVTSPVELNVPGGVLTVEWTPGNRPVMTGDAVREFATVV